MRDKDSVILEGLYYSIYSLNENKEDIDDLKDFEKEFKWYQDEGAFKKNLDLESKFNESTIKQRIPDSLDDVANCYTKLIRGKTEEERFNQWVKFYLKEKREKGTVRADTEIEKIEYLKKLLKAVKDGKTSPSVILQVKLENGVLEFMVGGRTRAAASKVADIKTNVRIIPINVEEVESLNKVKSVYDQLRIT